MSVDKAISGFQKCLTNLAKARDNEAAIVAENERLIVDAQARKAEAQAEVKRADKVISNLENLLDTTT